jgi:hypothetical protein
MPLIINYFLSRLILQLAGCGTSDLRLIARISSPTLSLMSTVGLASHS